MSNSGTFRSIVDVIQENARQNPAARIFTFLADGETETGTLTFGEIDLQARKLAAHLSQVVAFGDRAILLYPPGLENITAILGCIYAGIVLVPSLPLASNRSPDALVAVVADTQARLILTTSGQLAQLRRVVAPIPLLNRLILLATDHLDNMPGAEDWNAPPFEGNSLLALLYTSGSTQAARGIIIRHANAMQTVHRIQYGLSSGGAGVNVTWKPIYHSSGLGEIVFYPLVGQVPIVIMPPDAFLERPARWLETITRYRATGSGGPNFGYQLCVERIAPGEREQLDLSSWRMASVGTEPIQAKTLERFADTFAPYGFHKDAFFITYGLTEATMVISAASNPTTCAVQRSALERNEVVIVPAGETDSVSFVSCGRNTPGSELCIVDPATLTVCPPAHAGEIWVSKAFAFSGYWNKPEESERIFNAHLADTGQGPFLRTGDMGFIKDAELYVTGRLKDMIILRGRNFYSEDIEQVAGYAHPALMPGAAAAFSIPVNGEEQLAIIHEIKPDVQTINVEDVAQSIRRAMAQAMGMPVEAVVLVQAASLPRTVSGKIQRYVARAQFLARAPE